MKLHKRVKIVQEATNEYVGFYSDWSRKYDLTIGEILQIILSQLSHITKYIIRAERHTADPDTPGDLEQGGYYEPNTRNYPQVMGAVWQDTSPIRS